MKWYGRRKNYYNEKNYFIYNKKKYLQKKLKLYAVYSLNRFNFNNYKIILNLPSLWSFMVLKNKTSDFILYFYSNTYYFFLPIRSSFLLFIYDKFSKNFILTFQYINNFYRLFFYFFKLIFSSFISIFFRKIKFKGKGYYIYKNWRNTIALRFGYSHIKRLFFFFSHVKFLSKTSIFIFGINKFFIWKATNNLKKVRPINIFTGKGIRFTRQIIYRKTGKISAYR